MESSSLRGNNRSGSVAEMSSLSQQRKRIGRPPKIKQHQQQEQKQQQQLTLLKQSAQQQKQQAEYDMTESTTVTPRLLSTSLNECRRSSRKKIIKFDVRDLLNKNRNSQKTPKVQIEARIDSCTTKKHTVPEVSTMCSTDDIKQLINGLSEKKRGRPPGVAAVAPCAIIGDNVPKRGRGRPPKCRSLEMVAPPNDKPPTTKLSSSVSVLVKKLDLADGQVFKVTGNNCFEKIILPKQIDECRHTKKTTRITTPTTEYDIDDGEELIEEDNEEEDDDQQKMDDDDEVIFEISSTSSSPLRSNQLNDATYDDDVDDDNDDGVEEQCISVNHSNERRQRNFACVSFMEQHSQDSSGIADDGTLDSGQKIRPAISPQFYVAAVEEIIADTKEDSNNVSLEDIVYVEGDDDDDVVEEVVEEVEGTASAIDDSFIVIMDMKDDESMSCAVEDAPHTIDCDIEELPNEHHQYSSSPSIIINEFNAEQERASSTIEFYPSSVNSFSSRTPTNFTDDTQNADIPKETPQVRRIIFTRGGKEEQVCKEKLDITEEKHEENSADLDNVENSQDYDNFALCDDEQNDLSSADAKNDANMEGIIDDTTNLVGSMVIENECDSMSFELIEIMDDEEEGEEPHIALVNNEMLSEISTNAGENEKNAMITPTIVQEEAISNKINKEMLISEVVGENAKETCSNKITNMVENVSTAFEKNKKVNIEDIEKLANINISEDSSSVGNKKGKQLKNETILNANEKTKKPLIEEIEFSSKISLSADTEKTEKQKKRKNSKTNQIEEKESTTAETRSKAKIANKLALVVKKSDIKDSSPVAEKSERPKKITRSTSLNNKIEENTLIMAKKISVPKVKTSPELSDEEKRENQMKERISKTSANKLEANIHDFENSSMVPENSRKQKKETTFNKIEGNLSAVGRKSVIPTAKTLEDLLSAFEKSDKPHIEEIEQTAKIDDSKDQSSVAKNNGKQQKKSSKMVYSLSTTANTRGIDNSKIAKDLSTSVEKSLNPPIEELDSEDSSSIEEIGGNEKNTKLIDVNLRAISKDTIDLLSNTFEDLLSTYEKNGQEQIEKRELFANIKDPSLAEKSGNQKKAAKSSSTVQQKIEENLSIIAETTGTAEAKITKNCDDIETPPVEEKLDQSSKIADSEETSLVLSMIEHLKPITKIASLDESSSVEKEIGEKKDQISKATLKIEQRSSKISPSKIVETRNKPHSGESKESSKIDLTEKLSAIDEKSDHRKFEANELETIKYSSVGGENAKQKKSEILLNLQNQIVAKVSLIVDSKISAIVENIDNQNIIPDSAEEAEEKSEIAKTSTALLNDIEKKLSTIAFENQQETKDKSIISNDSSNVAENIVKPNILENCSKVVEISGNAEKAEISTILPKLDDLDDNRKETNDVTKCQIMENSSKIHSSEERNTAEIEKVSQLKIAEDPLIGKKSKNAHNNKRTMEDILPKIAKKQHVESKNEISKEEILCTSAVNTKETDKLKQPNISEEKPIIMEKSESSTNSETSHISNNKQNNGENENKAIENVLKTADSLPVNKNVGDEFKETEKNESKEALKNTKAFSDGINVETSTLIDILRTVQSNKLQTTDAVEILKNSNEEVKASSASPATVQRRRSEKRYSYVIEAARPKTLEETFAEIAHQSSKVVLEMAAVGSQLESITSNPSAVNNLEKETNNIACTDTRSCPDISVPRASSPKRRGRKPKQKTPNELPDTQVTTKPLTGHEELTVSQNVLDKEVYLDKKEDEINSLLSSNMPIMEATENNIEEIRETTTKTTKDEGEIIEVKLTDESQRKAKKERRKSRWDDPAFRTKEPDNELAIQKQERQKQLKEAFEAALSEVAQNNALNSNDENNSKKTLIEANIKLDLTDETLPLMLYKSMAAKLDKQMLTNNNNAPNHNDISNPLSDIEKFIADGVILLKQNTSEINAEKILDNKTEQPMEEKEALEINKDKIHETATTYNFIPEQILPKDHNINETMVNRSIADCEREPGDQDLEEVGEADEDMNEDGGKLIFEPTSKTFTLVRANYGAALETNGDDTAALRRSHRIKQKPQAPKALVGRGLVRDKERFSLKDDVETKAAYSLDDHLTDLAEVEAKNSKFLKDMEERLSNFQFIKENEYKCEHLVSKEARRMICDCFLTKEEEERGELGCGEDCLNRLLMIECGPNCNVKERCTNKRFQKFLSSPCRVFRTDKKGFGIMTDIEILPGEFIMEYVGEVLDSDEFERRRTAYSLDKNRHYYFMALRSDAIIDATTRGNISRFINHSCDPNAETQKWTVNGELRIGFFSRKSIMPGEEITFDYQYQRYGREAQRCYCESSNCRGWIGEEPNSDESEQGDDDSDDDDDLSDEEEEDDDDDDADPLEVQKKLESAAAAAKLVPITDEERRSKKHAKLEEEDSTAKFRQLLNKISEKVAKKKQEQRKASRGRPRKSLKNVGKNDGISPSKGRFLEDPDIEDEVNFLKTNGLKNQCDTLSLSRLMVRAKLPQTRLNLLEVLRQGEEPCRRLFLDYHGLRLLHGWMNENSQNMDIRLALLKTLKRLPISNKTVLKDSKVLQTMHSWCHQQKTHSNANNSLENNSSPSDESSKESTAVAVVPAPVASDLEQEVQKLAENLLASWDSLTEVFRIPKRERLERMKEHEREADRQYVATLEDDAQGKRKSVERTSGGDSQHQQRDRFGRRLPNHNNRSNTNRHNATTSSTVFRRRSDLESDDTRHLSKEKRREIFEAQVARAEAEKAMSSQRRGFEIKCQFFGLNDKRTKLEDIPFCANLTRGLWYAHNRKPITTPPLFRGLPLRPKYLSTNPNDYRLPKAVSQLPKNWKFAITPLGQIYYYHVQHRKPQWEPPIANQITTDSVPQTETEPDVNVESSDDEQILKDMDENELKVYKEQKVENRRRKRRNRLITERPISPRRDEDRAYNQQEVRKYKENKEKVRKRKEEIRKRRAELLKRASQNDDNISSNSEIKSIVKNDEIQDDMTSNSSATTSIGSETPNALPIQEHLLSSDEDHEMDMDDGDDYDDEADNKNSLLYKIVEGNKIVDELDALMTANVNLKRKLPPLTDQNSLAQQQQQQPPPLPQQQQQQQQQPLPPPLPQPQPTAMLTNDSSTASSTSSYHLDKLESYKRRKLDKKDKDRDKSKRNGSSSSSTGGSSSKDLDAKLRKIREKFRCDIAAFIVHYLKPYRKSSCQRGRIRDDDDYNHLARKLTHFVMIKETKYCESVGHTLVLTESVKSKSKEFIKKYMSKYDAVYVRNKNDPEFKEIPFNIKAIHEHRH